MRMVVGYEVGTKRARSVRVSKADRPDLGASIGVVEIDKEAEAIRAENGHFLGWHVYRDSSNRDLIFQCDPTDADRLSYVLKAIEHGDPAALVALLMGSYSEELKIDAIDHAMLVDPEDIERLKTWVSRLVTSIEYEEGRF